MHVASARSNAPLIELDLAAYHTMAQTNALFGQEGHSGAWAAAGSGSLILCGVTEAAAVQELLAERLAGRAPRAGPRLLIIAAAVPPQLESAQALLPVRLHVPALRQRPGDVLLLARYFAAERQITPLAAQILEHYPWPGNVSELRSVIMRAAQLVGVGSIDVVHLPERLQDTTADEPSRLGRLPAEGINLEQLEQALIRQALERARGNKSKAAELLGLSRHTLLYRMEKYRISAPEHR